MIARPDVPSGIVITLDTARAGHYVSAECQLDAHHGCPDGLRDECGARVLVCLCDPSGCPCVRNLPSGSPTGGPNQPLAIRSKRPDQPSVPSRA